MTENTKEAYNYTPTGYYHRFNCATARVLGSLFHFYPEKIDNHKIAEHSGIHVSRVSKIISRWFTNHYPYASRYQVKGAGRRKFLYKIRKPGAKAFLDFSNRISKGFDLNRQRQYPIKVDEYIVLRQSGIDMGKTKDDLPDLTDILQNIL